MGYFRACYPESDKKNSQAVSGQALSWSRKNDQTPEVEPRANPSRRSHCYSLAESEHTPGRQDKPGITDSPEGRPNKAGVTDATQGRVIECGMTDASYCQVRRKRSLLRMAERKRHLWELNEFLTIEGTSVGVADAVHAQGFRKDLIHTFSPELARHAEAAAQHLINKDLREGGKIMNA